MLLSLYNTSKCWWLPTSWRNDVRSQKTWIFNNIVAITWNVSSKKYCLLQVVVAALLSVSSAALVKRYPDPVNCHKYYLRVDDIFYELNCPNNLVFDDTTEQCITNTCTTPTIQWLPQSNCTQNMLGYFCASQNTFTYCTKDNKIIIKNVPCPSGYGCTGNQTNPCVKWVWYTYST